MLKPLHLLAAVFCALISYSQKTDTLTLFYKPDQYTISKQDKEKLDSFMLRGWDRLSINGYTDETEGEEYNLKLSKKRSGEVYWYLMTKNIPVNAISTQYFGEASPQWDNDTEDGRAMNRRTTLIGYQFAKINAKINVKPKEDLMKPVTRTLDNGLIITFRPGATAYQLSNNLYAGSGIDFQLLSNTTQMRERALYNNTTQGEILSSVMILCADQLDPCNTDSVYLQVPAPFELKCDLQKVKFFNTTIVDGKKIWQEQNKFVKAEWIEGRQYMGVWIDNFCGCVNFDFKIPECFDLDSSVLFVNADIRNLNAELKGINSVYLPRQVDDDKHSLVYLKDQKDNMAISFALYEGKRRIKSFRNRSLDAFPYDSASKQYKLSTGSHKFYFPKAKVFDVVLKVNGDKYRVYPEKDKCEVVYLNRKAENILVDFSTMDRRGRYTLYKDQPLESLPLDENSGYRVVDKDFIKALKEKGAVAAK